MIAIIVGLIVALIIIVVVVNAVQQHKEKVEQEKRAQVAKHKAIIDETEELLVNIANLPQNPSVVAILNRRNLNAAKAIKQVMPDTKGIDGRVKDYEERSRAAQELADKQSGSEDSFTLPDNEQHLLAILQCIKKLRSILKSEQSKGAIDAQVFMAEDRRLDAMQLKINIESMVKRGNQAYAKEMVGSARQYYEKALQTLNSHPVRSDYTMTKKEEIENKLEEITNALKNSNAQDRAKKAEEEQDELDMLFQPKKKW